MSNAMTNPFENELPTVDSLGMPVTMTPMDAFKFARWYIDKFGHKGPMGPEEWIQFGDQWKEESGYASSGTTVAGQGSGLDDYLNDRGSGNNNNADNNYTGSSANNYTESSANNYTESSAVDYSEDQLDEDGYPKEANEGDVFTDGQGKQWEAHNAQTVDSETGEVVSEETEWRPYSGSASSKMSGGLADLFDLLSGIKGIEGDYGRAGKWGLLGQIFGGQFSDGIGAGLPGALGNILDIFGLGQGSIGDSAKEGDWSELLKQLLAGKKDLEMVKRLEVPVGQMASQSKVGKDWGLPSKESMVMQGLGPNYLEGQKYAMNKGVPMPAATHVGGLPLVEEIEGGEQGGIMGLKSHGDITPAFLEPGEFVFTKKATDNVGAKRLYKLMQQAEQMGMR